MMNKYSGFKGNTSSRFGREMANRNTEKDEEERMRRLRELFNGRFRMNVPMRRGTGYSGGSGRGGTGGNSGGGGGTGNDGVGGGTGNGDNGRGGNDRILT